MHYAAFSRGFSELFQGLELRERKAVSQSAFRNTGALCLRISRFPRPFACFGCRHFYITADYVKGLQFSAEQKNCLSGFTQRSDKLVFVKYMLSLRTSAHTGVAIPRIEGKCTEKHPKMGTSAIFGGNRYLDPFNRGIATPVCALARNDSVISTNTNLSVQA